MNKHKQELEVSLNEITIFICSINPNKLIDYSLQSIENCPNITFVILLDSKCADQILRLNTFKFNNCKIIKSEETGLSSLRNQSIYMCESKYIVFLDDDVTFTENQIIELYDGFLQGNVAIGGLLQFNTIPQLSYFGVNQYHYVGVHSGYSIINNSIWGACMGFDVSILKINKIFFNLSLDRQNNSFLSGGDTSLITELRKKAFSTKLMHKITFTHNVSKERLTFTNLLKRVIWQGITEVKRKNIVGSILKEYERNFHSLKLETLFWSFFWFSIFLIGLFIGGIHSSKFFFIFSSQKKNSKY